jgi:hypothetical protein
MKVRRKQTLILLAGIVIGASLVGTSIAVTSNSFRYSETKTGYLSFSPSEFIVDTSTDAYSNVFDEGGFEGECFATTGVHLPHGARAKSVTFYYEAQGSTPSQTFLGEFHRRRANNLDASGYPPFVLMTNPGTLEAGGTDPSKITGQVRDGKELIDNKNFEYLLAICPKSAGIFYGARIRYTYRTAGD